MNSISIIGNLVRDNELKYTQSGRAVLSNVVAINEGFGDKQKTYFIPFVAWEKQAENAANYTGKGSKVAVNGKITSRRFEDKQGNKRTVVEVVANPYQGIEFLDNAQKGRNNQNTGDQNANSHNQTSSQQNSTQGNSDPFGGSSIDIDGESLPF